MEKMLVKLHQFLGMRAIVDLISSRLITLACIMVRDNLSILMFRRVDSKLCRYISFRAERNKLHEVQFHQMKTDNVGNQFLNPSGSISVYILQAIGVTNTVQTHPQ